MIDASVERLDPSASVGDVAYIALGSNLGDRAQHLADARDRLAAVPGITMLRASRIEETAPIGPAGQSMYLNQMIAVHTTLSPRALLQQLQAIELAGGRTRGANDPRWGPRTIDLDIVRFEHLTCNDPDLIIPHPELPHREFWQRELAELL